MRFASPAPSAVLNPTQFWLVELLPAFPGHPAFSPIYYSGMPLTEDGRSAIRTADPLAAPRWLRREDAAAVARRLLGTISCHWRAAAYEFGADGSVRACDHDAPGSLPDCSLPSTPDNAKACLARL